MESGEAVEIYRDRLTGEALLARILQRSSRVLAIEELDETGQHDGVGIARLADVTRLRRGSRELQLTNASPVVEGLRLPEIGLLELTSGITMLEKRYGYVTIHLERSSSTALFIGQVTAIDDDFIELHEYAPFRSMDRPLILIKHDEITYVGAGGRYEQELLRRHDAIRKDTR